jgi:hypothetical protein
VLVRVVVVVVRQWTRRLQDAASGRVLTTVQPPMAATAVVLVLVLVLRVALEGVVVERHRDLTFAPTMTCT